MVVTGKNITQGTALAEVYELFGPGLDSKLGNVSGRGFVGTGDNVLIGGFIVGDVGSGTVVVRALGPSLASFGVSQPLSDPILTIYDSKGSVIATNDNWQDGNNASDVQRNGLAAAQCARLGNCASPACRGIYRGNPRSEWRYWQCFSRGLSSPVVTF